MKRSLAIILLSLITFVTVSRSPNKQVQIYDVTMTTTMTLPKGSRRYEAIQVWHALPTRRPWSPGKTGVGAINLSFTPNDGKEDYNHEKDSYQVYWDLSKDLKPGKRLSFVSQFRVESESRRFDPSTAKAKWSDFTNKPKAVHPTIDKIADDIRKAHPPAEAILEFCRWIERTLTYDASVTYDSENIEAILKHRMGHCGHYETIFEALCSRVGIPEREVFGLSLYAPDGRTGGLQHVRADFTNIHAWAEVELPGAGWVEVEPAGGDQAYEIPATCIQNNRWFENYSVWFEEGGRWKYLDWRLVKGRWICPFQLEHIITYTVAKP